MAESQNKCAEEKQKDKEYNCMIPSLENYRKIQTKIQEQKKKRLDTQGWACNRKCKEEL